MDSKLLPLWRLATESSQKGESRALSADSSKACSKTRPFLIKKLAVKSRVFK